MNSGMMNFVANMEVWSRKQRPDYRIAEKS